MKKTISIGYIGLGRRGMYFLENCLVDMPDVKIAAICDLNPDKINKTINLLLEKGHPMPAVFSDYHAMLQMQELDAVVIMTNWTGRVRCAIDCMEAGKYAAIEVGCAFDLSECYALVDAYERTGVPVMMLENCCYGRREMMALRMVKEGLFGEIIQCSGAYRHYLNSEELFKKNDDGTYDTDHYRLQEYAHHNCEIYPTHDLGPISKVLGINRGNRMLSLTSYSTKSRGLETYVRDHVSPEHPEYNTHFIQGDIVTTIITCSGGEQIILTLDNTLPRPFYSRDFTVRGTKGMCVESTGDVGTFYLDGMEEPVFNNEKEFYEKYDHPLHADYARFEAKGGHGGIDWLVMRAFFESVKHGTQTPIDVYDTAAWLAIGPLSEASIAAGSIPVAIPDFTRGKWYRREPAIFGKYSLDLICDDPDTPIFPE